MSNEVLQKIVDMKKEIKSLHDYLEIEKNKNYILKDFILNNMPFSEDIVESLEEEALG